jgi:hypothetical protein
MRAVVESGGSLPYMYTVGRCIGSKQVVATSHHAAPPAPPHSPEAF